MAATFRSVMHTCDGQVIVKERPMLECRDQFVLVENKFSTMSPGTHCTILRNLRAKADPSGLSYTLGYTGAGIVREIGRGVTNVAVGDRVAIYGSPYTFEGEYCVVPKLLCHKVPEGVSLELASSVGLGVIAMHAVRRAEVELGSRVLIVGLGVLGILASQYVQNSGGFLIACDRDARRRIEIARKLVPGARIFSTLEMSITDAVRAEFGASKLDCAVVFVTGAQELGTEISRNVRNRGSIVLGGGDIGLSSANTSGVEQNVLTSRAGGPGRGIPEYEQEGKDYPIEYVRFTEGRNMEVYLELLRRKRIDVAPLIDRVTRSKRRPPSMSAC